MRALTKVSLVGVAGRLHGNGESGLHSNSSPADFQKTRVSGSRGAEAVYWQLWLPQHSVGEQPGEQVGTNVQMPLPHPHSVSL